MLKSSSSHSSMHDVKFKMTVCSRLQPSDSPTFNFRVIIHDEQLSAALLCAKWFTSECSHPSKEVYSISYNQADKLVKEVGAKWQIHDNLPFSSFTADREFLINWERKINMQKDDPIFFNIDKSGNIKLVEVADAGLANFARMSACLLYFNLEAGCGFCRLPAVIAENLQEEVICQLVQKFRNSEDKIYSIPDFVKFSAVSWNGTRCEVADGLKGFWNGDFFISLDENTGKIGDKYSRFDVDQIDFSKVKENGYFGSVISFTKSGSQLLSFCIEQIGNALKEKARRIYATEEAIRLNLLCKSNFRATVCDRCHGRQMFLIHDKELSPSELLQERFKDEYFSPTKEVYSLTGEQATRLVKETNSEWEELNGKTFFGFLVGSTFLDKLREELKGNK